MLRRSRTILRLLVLTGLPIVLQGGCTRAAGPGASHHKEDVIYGRKDGMALTMDVFTPVGKPNGAGVIWLASGAWFSAHRIIEESVPFSPINELQQRGYTVFAVVHGSQPKYNIPEILGDINRSVRYIRYHAASYGIDPQRIGITGASSGGHLSLMQAMAGDSGDPLAEDPVDRTSSRVQAVACFFPPTDFLNYGKPGRIALGNGTLHGLKGAFAFRQPDPRPHTPGMLVPVTDPVKIRKIGHDISPINFVTRDDPPTFIIHGDKDPLVPLQQSETMMARLKAVGVPAQLVIKPGGGHGWNGLEKDMPQIVDWFDKYLLK